MHFYEMYVERFVQFVRGVFDYLDKLCVDFWEGVRRDFNRLRAAQLAELCEDLDRLRSGLFHELRADFDR